MKSIKNFKSFQESRTTKGITFIVTKDCQLACKYCYLVGKNSKEQLSFEVAKKAIDYILINKEYCKEDIIFIGIIDYNTEYPEVIDYVNERLEHICKKHDINFI